MDDTSFDEVPLLGRQTEDLHRDANTSKVRRRLEGPNGSNETIQDPFAISDEDFEKLSLYRPQRSQGAFTIGGVFWMLSSIWVLYYTQLPIVLKADERVDWFWLSLAGLMLLVCLSVATFFIVYLSWIRKVSSDDWEKHFPVGIPVATATFLLFSLFTNLALWPVFSYFTPLILLSQFMGGITFLALLP